ncbi:alpha/beta hydrolase [Demequina sp. TTPB684]|uniref:alpha/beta fold hydrolase n=1 Tax=unclassified Demequina TaxID=2620311 RepID=UPI001CF53B6A|nr:alpha/beta fold hydrolase [Demequina sp. TMPB413]MCB2413477.1 alpha/beta hydrolase [Demequina sp. TTPB684]UPU88779.1 alpha/beta hydrolase [Demequina sp. TMPB413]
MIVHDLETEQGVIRWREQGDADAPLTAIWHHGTPGIGAPPAPLLDASEERGIRWLSFDRPGYGGSTPTDAWSIIDAAATTARVASAAGAETFVVVGHSGGGPNALACAAVLGERVKAAVSIAGLAPYDAAGLEWFAGMYDGGEAELRSAVTGADALRAFVEDLEYDPLMFTAADLEALEGRWSSFNGLAAAGVAEGMGGVVADNLSYVRPWGFDVAGVAAPTLLLHGTDDRVVPVAHSRWLAEHIPGVEFWERSGDGHVSVMNGVFDALDWLGARP